MYTLYLSPSPSLREVTAFYDSEMKMRELQVGVCGGDANGMVLVSVLCSFYTLAMQPLHTISCFALLQPPIHSLLLLPSLPTHTHPKNNSLSPDLPATTRSLSCA